MRYLANKASCRLEDKYMQLSYEVLGWNWTTNNFCIVLETT